MSDTRCTCVIVKAPTYDVYVQTPCGIHLRMVEDMKLQNDEYRKALETIARIGPKDFAAFGAQALMTAVNVAKVALMEKRIVLCPKCGHTDEVHTDECRCTDSVCLRFRG